MLPFLFCLCMRFLGAKASGKPVAKWQIQAQKNRCSRFGTKAISNNKKDLWLVLAGENDIAHKGNVGKTMSVKIG